MIIKKIFVLKNNRENSLKKNFFIFEKLNGKITHSFHNGLLYKPVISSAFRRFKKYGEFIFTRKYGDIHNKKTRNKRVKNNKK